MSDVFEHRRPAPVRALDESSGRLVRPEGRLDESTMRLHEASTVPERSVVSTNAFELRNRGAEGLWLPRSVVDEVLQRAPDADNRSPAPVELRDDPPTMPDTSDRPSSDVFESRVVEAPTPIDRPLRIDERPTDLEVRRVERTVTYHPARNIPVREEERDSQRDRATVATALERALVERMYESQRRYLVIASDEPTRATHIASLADKLKDSDVFANRQRVLAIHARQRVALEELPAAERRKDHEDQVLAIGLVARDLDDRYRETMRQLRDQLVGEVPALPADKRDAVYADFESFVETGAANDSHFCRRELDNALNNEVVLHRAYVYALALAQPRPRPELEKAESLNDDERKKKAGK